MKEFVISGNEEGGKLERYLQKRMPGAPRNLLFKMIRKKNITLNGARTDAGAVLREGDVLRIYFSDETYAKFAGAKKASEDKANSAESSSGHAGALRGNAGAGSGGVPGVIYEDEDIILIDKPSGMLTQKAEAGDFSLNDWLIDYLIKRGDYDPASGSTFVPAVANRLDRNTSGIVAAGKSKKGLIWLSSGFKNHTIIKCYICAVLGRIESQGEIKGYLVKDEKTNTVRFSEDEVPGGLWSETLYKPYKTYDSISVVRVKLLTGRTHQIRVHMAHIGHPLLGDRKYGDKTVNALAARQAGVKSQMLHCYMLTLPDGRVFESVPPEEFNKGIERLKNIEF